MARQLRYLIGDLTPENISATIIADVAQQPTRTTSPVLEKEKAVPIVMSGEAYNLLNGAFTGVSDAHLLQLLLETLSR